MEREKGYLDLDLLKNKVKVIESIFRRQGILYHIDIDEDEYFFKECGYRDAITELVVSEMLSKINVPNVKYDLTKFKYKRGVTSKSFKKEGNRYFSGRVIIDNYLRALEEEYEREKGTPHGEVLFEEYQMYKNGVDSNYSINNLELIMHAVEYHVKDRKNPQRDFENIMKSLVEYYLADLLFLNQDRNRTNWWIEENDACIEVCPAFDHAESLREGNWKSLRVEPYDESKFKPNVYTELEKFFMKSEQSYFEKFVQMRNMISVDVLEECIRIVESKIKCEIKPDVKEKMVETYKGHLEKIDIIIDKRKNRKEKVKAKENRDIEVR